MTTVRQKYFLDAENSLLVIIDVQERLCKAMDEQALQSLIDNTNILIDAAAELSVPTLVTEQYVKGLGATHSGLCERLGESPRFEKMSFSCCGSEAFTDSIRSSGRRQIIISGMETHVCVLQTALELLDAGYTVHLVQDAVVSRASQNRATALAVMQQAGAVITCTESVMFQWLKVAGTESFKKLSKLVK